MIWPTSPGLSVIASSASSARPLSPVAEGPFRRRTGSGQYSTPPPFGRSLRAMGSCSCVRRVRSCCRCAHGRSAVMPRSCSGIVRPSKMPSAPPPRSVGRAMRDPRPGLIWSIGRLRRRAAYCDYMSSPQWFALRERWAKDWTTRHCIEPCCLICGVPWLLERGDLHHRSYSRLGHERSRDLIPLCRICHMALHRVLEFDRSWRRLDRAQATDLIVKALRRKGARHRWVSHEINVKEGCR